MNLAYLNSSEISFFSDAQAQLDYIISPLSSEQNINWSHGVIEQVLNHGDIDISPHFAPKKLIFDEILTG